VSQGETATIINQLDVELDDASDSAATISVEVAYALPHKQSLVALSVPDGSTALEAAKRSGIANDYPELEIDESTRLGIFGQLVASTQPLREGDRVEIYRPLLADPKEVRKERAARARARRESAADSDAEKTDAGDAGSDHPGGIQADR